MSKRLKTGSGALSVTKWNDRKQESRDSEGFKDYDKSRRRTHGMELLKETKSFGLLAESQYGYVQGVKVGRNIYISGQLSHDEEGNIVGAAPLDDSGHIADHSNMKVQMQQAYVNAQRVLAQFGATLDNVIEEVLYVTDMDQALAVAGPVRREAYGVATPQVASTILVTPRLAYRNQLIEIKFVAMHGLDIR